MKLLLKLCLFAAASFSCLADAIYVPPGLNPGDTYRLIFITDTTTESAGETDADLNAFVTADAENNPGLAALNTTWTALASDSNTNVLANTGLSAADTTTLFYNTLGQLIAIGVFNADSGLYDSGDGFDLHTATIYDPNGNAGTWAWTGTNDYGVSDFFSIGGRLTVFGDSTQSVGWSAADAGPATDLLAVYAVSGILTVPTPEPSTLLTAALSVAALLALRLRR